MWSKIDESLYDWADFTYNPGSGNARTDEKHKINM